MLSVILASGLAMAAIDDACLDTAAGGPPADYDEQGQQNFLLNYFSLATTFSPTHAPVPTPAGKGSVGIEFAGIPPLSCARRLVLNYTKTEDTNKSPVAPRIRATFSFPRIGKKLTPYAGVGYVPPVEVFGTRNVIASGELGIGVSSPDNRGFQWGARYHFTLMRTIAEIATPFSEDEEAFDDFYMGSTFGLDAMAGYRVAKWTPYVSVGVTDVSTFFFIGDDNIVTNNTDPYFGLVASAGTQWRVSEHVQLAGELYAAPGAIFTGRLRAAWVF